MADNEWGVNIALERIYEACKGEYELLDLSNLGLSFLPGNLHNLTFLKKLDLSNNQLNQISKVFWYLDTLQELSLDNNNLSYLPKSLGQLSSLKVLSLEHNQLSELPQFLGQLSSLQRLYLTDNQLKEIPESIGQLSSLKVLSLYKNQLNELPESVGQLSSLERLYLTDNQLSELPESLGQLSSLQYLYLSNNQLSELPESLGQLRSLQRLFLHENEKLQLPPEVLGPTWIEVEEEGRIIPKIRDILNYYFSLPERGSRPLNEAKLILVGFGEVGKTSLVNRLVDGTFDPAETKTDGINITKWPIQIPPDEDIRLNIWDFGGQEIMHSTHQFFLTERSLYLLVLNGRQGHEDEDAEYWLNLIKSFGKDSPVIVVLNKFSETAFDLNRSYLRQKFPIIRHFIETDCGDGDGQHPSGRNINELKQLIKTEADLLENLRIPFPGSWSKVKNYLSKMSDNFISFEEFRQLCKNNGEPETSKQNTLANILHQLGLSLNYREDPRLRDTQILNPHWVTNGIYTIINGESLNNCKGVLPLKQLAEILDLDDYPTERHSFLLELMRKFELAFRIDDTETRYLVTDLLDKQQPPEAEAFNLETCLNFQYQYPTILPEGIIPRFITRTYPLSSHTPRWRTGVILRKNGNRALVVSDRSNKRIDIAIDGPIGTRQELLAIIRYDFDRIHSSFSFKPAEQVPVPGHPNTLLSYQELSLLYQGGIETTYREVAGEIKELNVQELLEGVDLPAMPTDPLKLFYSYAHEDEALRDQLETHLKLLQRQGYIDPWHDRRITAGDEWKDEIDINLEQADIILLLISADFIASDYCYDIELKKAMERHETGEARVIPIILRKTEGWNRNTPFGRLQALPKDSKPIKLWDDRDSAWADVAKGIRNVIAKMQASS